MKILDSNTGYILFKASVDSDYNDAAYALVKIDEGMVRTLTIVHDYATKLQAEVGHLYQVELFHPVEAWLDWNEDIHQLCIDAGKELMYDPVFIELSDDDLDNLFQGSLTDEERITVETVSVKFDGEISFNGIGKYSGETYSTNSININQL